MKKITLVLILLSTLPAFSQYCQVADPSNVNLKSAAFNYVPGSPLKYIRIIIHFIQKDDGTGNFNETNDGMSPANNFNGYDFASYITNYANSLLEDNHSMNLQPFGNVPVYDPGYRYQLSGVFFWRNSTLYNSYGALNSLQTIYGQSTNSAINIFITSPQGNTGGYARQIGDNAVILFRPYTNYVESVNNNNGWYNRASGIIINHEVGHCLNLFHTMLTNGGICDNKWEDYCNDTPTIQQMLNLSKPDPCCWNDVYCSNNLMDYNAEMQSITPDQLDRIHSSLTNDKLNFTACNYQNNSLTISTFGNNSGEYIAKYITVSGTSSIIPNSKTVYIEGDEITLNSGFEVQLGGKLNIYTNPSCN